ncbi:hypothetical protein ABEV74_10505 [Paenibacillus cisolokensis]|uniref:hypothetical protein n=1 Tax=Paenibacillus cisolokensis TaxID=1658519 RepID=UPI003D2CD50B
MTEYFYCVGCNKLVQIEEAKWLFRTGFFRIVHPLGCCESCSSDHAAQPGPDREIRRGMQTYSSKPEHAAAVLPKMDEQESVYTVNLHAEAVVSPL